MARVSYVNGLYLSHSQAGVHIEDRGFQFADGVYEVLPVLGGRVRHLDQHLDRLDRSLAALRIHWPVARAALPVILAQVLRRNRVTDGVAYVQATRGSAHRNHLFPDHVEPGLVVSAWPQKGPSAKLVEEGVAVVTCPDQRWKRPDIKSVSLLPNVLARQGAKESGAYEAWLVNERGEVTEGAATNAYMVDAAGTLRTHPANGAILAGVTRANLLRLAAEAGIRVDERAFTVEEAKTAAEAFISGTTFMVLPVTHLDGGPIGTGRPGPVTQKLRHLYERFRAQ